MKRCLLLALVIVFVAAAAAAAAATSVEGEELPLQPGDRVRVGAYGMERIFVVEELLPEALMLRDPDGIMPQKVRIGDISSLAIGVPNSPARGAAHGAVIGALIGLLSGFVTGFAVGDDPGYDENSNSELTLEMSAEGKAWAYGGTLCAAGAFIGAIVGASLPGERWESIPLNGKLVAGMARDGTARVGIAFSIMRGVGE
jgi:hypothetical protein